MVDMNTILQQYHEEFDDSKVRELLEELEQMMHERASFFTNRSDVDEDSTLFDEMDNYWHDLDNLGHGSNPHNEILDKLRDDVKGLGICSCCKKMGVIKPKVVSSVLSLSDKNKVYLVRLCETCISKKSWVMEYKEEIEKSTLVPLELPELEKQLMIQYQNTLSKQEK